MSSNDVSLCVEIDRLEAENKNLEAMVDRLHKRCEVLHDRVEGVEAENKSLIDCLRVMYKNHGHGTWMEAGHMWNKIGDSFDFKAPDEECIKRFWEVKR